MLYYIRSILRTCLRWIKAGLVRVPVVRYRSVLWMCLRDGCSFCPVLPTTEPQWLWASYDWMQNQVSVIFCSHQQPNASFKSIYMFEEHAWRWFIWHKCHHLDTVCLCLDACMNLEWTEWSCLCIYICIYTAYTLMLVTYLDQWISTGFASGQQVVNHSIKILSHRRRKKVLKTKY